jgi:plastocyanin
MLPARPVTSVAGNGKDPMAAPSTSRLRQLRPVHYAGLTLALLGTILLVGAPGWWWPEGRTAGVIVGVTSNDTFSPRAVTVNAGDTVTWQFDGSRHTVTSISGPGPSWTSGEQSAGTFDHTFTQAGTYEYVCALHGNMSGTVVVNAAPSSGGPGPSGPGTATGPVATVPGSPATAGTAAGAPKTVRGGAPAADGAATHLAAPGTTASARSEPAVSRARLARGRRPAVRLTLTRAARVTVVATRRGSRTVVAARSLGAGATRLRLHTAALRTGSYRIAVTARDAAGARTSLAAGSLRVAARAR